MQCLCNVQHQGVMLYRQGFRVKGFGMSTRRVFDLLGRHPDIDDAEVITETVTDKGVALVHQVPQLYICVEFVYVIFT